MDQAITTLLMQGIAAARAGKRAEAHALLTRVVAADVHSEQGWLWLAGVSDDPAEVRSCLHQVLALNPDSVPAKQGLAWAEQRFGPEPLLEQAVGAPSIQPMPKPAAPERPAITTTTVSLSRHEFEQAAAKHPAARPPTTRLREPVFDPLSPSLAGNAPAAPRPPTMRLPATEASSAATASNAAPPTPMVRSTRPAAPTVLMEAVAPAPAAAPPKPTPAEAPTRAPIAPADIAPSAPPENPCPFCGAPTMVKQQRCTQCSHSLMVRAPLPAQRSATLTALGATWAINGVIALAGAALLGLLLLFQRQSTAAANLVPSGLLAIVLAAVLLFGLLCFGVARGLWARVREFYWMNIGLIAIVVIVWLGLLLRGAGLLAGLTKLVGQVSPWPGVVGALSAALPIVLGVLLVLLPAILSVPSYRDFFGPLIRFMPPAEKADHAEHYNRGIGYRNQDMWYMAVQEWFTAARMRPHERTYLQALGLAYAQIKQLYPNAKAYLSDVETLLRGRKADLYAAAPELERLKLLD